MQFWAELVNTAVYLEARTPTIALHGRTPYEVPHKKPAEISHLRRFGCVAYHRIPDESFKNKTMLKFGSRSKRCMLLGYMDSTTIWNLWDQSGNGRRGRIIRSTDIVFKEEENAIGSLR